MFSGTLRFRLTALYGAIFVLCSLMLFLFSYLLLNTLMRGDERANSDARLLELWIMYQSGGLRLVEQELAVERLVPQQRPFMVRIAGPGNATIYLYVPGGLRDFDYTALERAETPGADRALDLEALSGPQTLEVRSLGMPDGNILQIGTSNHQRLEALGRFRRSFLLAFVPLMGLGIAAGLLLSARALKPVRDLTAVTHRIVETGGIQERVPRSRGGDELDELVLLFNRMLDRIESLIRGMRDALDSVAHDLRTPLTRLRAQAELALAPEPGEEGAYRAALAGSIEESERMLSLLGTLMDISAAQTGVMRLERSTVDVGAVIDDLAELHGYAGEEKGLTVQAQVQPGLAVDGDINRLRQVISNLLDNAVKYTPPGGSVRIDARREGAEVLITVRDTGVGIPAHELGRIWDRLYRGEGGRSQPGLGLGLSVVKAVVQAHGGSCDVSSTPGEGSAFTVRLPAL